MSSSLVTAKNRRPRLSGAAYLIILAVAVLIAAWWGYSSNRKLFVIASMNGLTTAALYFLVAVGFTLIFGLMKHINLTHGALYLLGDYIGYTAAELKGSRLVGSDGGPVAVACTGLVVPVALFRFL